MSTRPWIELLANVVPDERDTMLLRAMLWDGEAAREQWLKWVECVGQPRAYFEREFVGRKGLLAFLGQRLSENGTDTGPEFATYMRVAQVREELRSKIFIDVLGEAITALDARGSYPVLINGAGYAFTVYANALVRHNHGIDFLVCPADVRVTRRAVESIGFEPVRETAVDPGIFAEYQHGSGLALTIRSVLFRTPHLERDASGSLTGSREIDIAGSRIRVLSTVDRLCHTLGEAATGTTRRNLRWACDVFLLLTASDRIDYDRLAERTLELEIALPSTLLLGFFHRELSVEMPASGIGRMLDEGAPDSPDGVNYLFSTALRTSGSVHRFLRGARADNVLFAKAVRFALAPSADHLIYQFGIKNRLLVPVMYLFRALRYLWYRLCRQSLRATSLPAPNGPLDVKPRFGGKADS